MQKFAHIISNLFQPLLFPTYSLILLFQVGNFAYTDFSYKAFTIFSIFLLTAIVPLVVILVLKKMGVVSSIQLSERKERTVPYLFTIFSYIAAVIFLWRIYMPSYIVAMMTGIVTSTLIIMLINTKWKISAHLSAMGGLCAAIIVVSFHSALNPVWVLSMAFILAGLVATSRIFLKVHTPMQTLAGFCMGFLFMFVFGMMY